MLDCSDAILDHALTSATAFAPVAREGTAAPIIASEEQLSSVSSATSDSDRAPGRESVPVPRAPNASCPSASAVPLPLGLALPHPAMRDNASRPEPGDFTLPQGPALELRLRPPLTSLG